MNASLAEKVGGECCQRDCRQITSDVQRAAQTSDCALATLEVAGRDETGGKPCRTTTCGNKLLSHFVAFRTTYRMLSYLISFIVF